MPGNLHQMRVACRSRRAPLLPLLVALLAAALVVAWLVPAPAEAADARLQRAQSQRNEVQRRLNGLLQRLDEVQSEEAAAEARLSDLESQEAAHATRAVEATSLLGQRMRESYKRGIADPTLSILSSGSPQEAASQARLLGLLALRSRAEYEGASAARVNTRVTAEEVERVAAELESRRAELDRIRGQVAAELAKAQRQVAQVETVLAAEQAARERAAARAAGQSRASRGSRAAGAAAPVVGSVACPVGSPRSYRDTWGAPRSGGRRHKGTDIMAPRGVGIYAYENGRITRLTNSRLGGISVYMRGDSGNLYYYTHLQGYVSGLGTGQRVSVGEHIAFNGDTGNARGMPHLHFEVMPGGGGNVNPYPFVRRACG